MRETDRPKGIITTACGVAFVSPLAFKRLRDYSCSLPTGQTIGKQWKRRRSYEHESMGWQLGEYSGCNQPGHVSIIWRDLIVAHRIETRYVNGRECRACGWWHVPLLPVFNQPNPVEDDIHICPKCGNRFASANRLNAFDPFATIRVARDWARRVWWKPWTWWPGPWRKVTHENK